MSCMFFRLSVPTSSNDGSGVCEDYGCLTVTNMVHLSDTTDIDLFHVSIQVPGAAPIGENWEEGDFSENEVILAGSKIVIRCDFFDFIEISNEWARQDGPDNGWDATPEVYIEQMENSEGEDYEYKSLVIITNKEMTVGNNYWFIFAAEFSSDRF